MLFKIFLVLIFVLVFGCQERNNQTVKNLLLSTQQNKSNYIEPTFTYQTQKLTDFFQNLYDNHKIGIQKKYQRQFSSFCDDLSLSKSNLQNQNKFYMLIFFHNLFTCSNAVNGNKGGILKIPYFWHWINPNPRYEIISNNSSKKLSELKPE